MAQTKMYEKRARAELLDELTAALALPATDLVVSPGDETTTVTFPDAVDPALVDAVVAAHDPTVYEQAEDAARGQYQTAVAYLKTIRATPNANITIDQVKNATKALTDIAKVQHQQLREE